ncbi:unnamed protein product, partial [Didymodactylos carnosus]
MDDGRISSQTMEQHSISNEHSELARIIQSNHYIRKTVQDATNKFLTLQNDLLKSMQVQRLDTITVEQNAQPFFDAVEIRSLNEQVTSDRVQLAFVGANSCGKTSFLHLLLRSGSFLPADVGSTSARIIRLTYATVRDACLIVYPSLDNKEVIVQVSLVEFFIDGQKPDWDGVKTAIRVHVERPDTENIKPHSNEFAQWAKYFVELRIPSSFLKLGIDIYDTPGLLFSDPLVLKENLRELVELVKPTLVFMYDNAAVSSDSQDCFLAVKDALGQLADTSMFFLNTKADITVILADADPNGEGIEDEKWPEILLAERQTRYNLLLKVPSMASEFPGGLPESFAKCHCFDIVSVHSDLDPLGSEMNRTTISRMIQFVANSDLKIAKKVSQLVLPVIDAFFDFALVTSQRTAAQLQTLRHEACQWTANYFIKHRSQLQKMLAELYDLILDQLNDEMNCIAQRAAKLKTAPLIEKYIKAVVQQEIVKMNVELVTRKHATISGREIKADPTILNNADKNEFLISAQRSFTISRNYYDNKCTSRLFMIQAMLLQTALIADILIESDDEGGSKDTKYKTIVRQDTRKKLPLRKGMSSLEIAYQRLSELQSWLVNQKAYMSKVVDVLNNTQKQHLIEKIDQRYNLAVKGVSDREKAYQLVTIYVGAFAHIECRLVAAIDLAKFHGRKPVINKML